MVHESHLRSCSRGEWGWAKVIVYSEYTHRFAHFGIVLIKKVSYYAFASLPIDNFLHPGAMTKLSWFGSGTCLLLSLALLTETRSGHGLGKVFGSNEVNVENWRSVKRLVGHENGTTSANRFLTTKRCPRSKLESGQQDPGKRRPRQCHHGVECSDIWYNGLQWQGWGLEKIKRIESHQSHVKGITFDPALKYFATEVCPLRKRVHIFSRVMIVPSKYGGLQILHSRKQSLNPFTTRLLQLTSDVLHGLQTGHILQQPMLWTVQ